MKEAQPYDPITGPKELSVEAIQEFTNKLPAHLRHRHVLWLLAELEQVRQALDDEIAVRDKIIKKIERIAPNVLINGGPVEYAEAMIEASESREKRVREALEEFTLAFESDFVVDDEIVDDPDAYWTPLCGLYRAARRALEGE